MRNSKVNNGSVMKREVKLFLAVMIVVAILSYALTTTALAPLQHVPNPYSLP